MNLGPILRGCLVVSVVAVLTGCLLKITHWFAADWLLIVGLLAALGFTVAALVEIAGSRRVSGSEKILWMTVVLLGNALGALLYLAVGRQRVATGR